MAALVLMYHRTPPKADHILDVGISLFREQIIALQSSGFRFVRFSELLDPRWYGDETVVSITFDDGHGSNLEAFHFLEEAGIPCTSFFVSEYVRKGLDGFMDSTAFAEALLCCEVGGHGATHVGLAGLDQPHLILELGDSKKYLEDLSGREVLSMSVPGGSIDRSVLSEAIGAGFELVGDSKPLLNSSPRPQMHRICVQNGQTPESLLFLAQASRLYWLRQQLRYTSAAKSLGSLVLNTLGRERRDRLKRLLYGSE